MADPKEWGSLLWKIIHNTCAHLGNNTNIILQRDELRYFKAFQRKLFYIIPCKICRIHYKEYMVNIRDINYDNLKLYGTNYFYELHNKINSSNNKSLFKREDLENYNCFKDEYNILLSDFNKIFTKYTDLHYISIDELKDFNRILRILRNFINF
jgi:hypothetical protein